MRDHFKSPREVFILISRLNRVLPALTHPHASSFAFRLSGRTFLKSLILSAALVLPGCDGAAPMMGLDDLDPTLSLTLAVAPESHDFAAAGDKIQLTAEAVASDGSRIAGSEISWSTSDAGVATVDEAGAVTARGPGTTTIEASIGIVSAISDIEVLREPTPASASGSREPAGYSRITSRNFDSRGESGWDFNESGRFSIATDDSAPGSCCRVGQARYAAGYSGGKSPAVTWHSFGSEGHNELYVSFWLKLSDNWQGHSSGVNKIGFIWIHGDPAVYLSAQGSGSGTLRPEVRLQNVPGTSRNLTPNAASLAIERGKWHHWEVQLVANSGGNANGISRLWVDGTLVSDYRDVRFSDSGQSRSWEHLYWYPVWGGMGDTVKNDMSMSIDGIYASGR